MPVGVLCGGMRDDAVFKLFEEPVLAAEAQAVIDGMSRYDFGSAREEAISRYCFAVPCVEAVKLLVSLSPLLEVGAGSGCWAKLVRAAGGVVVATDLCGLEMSGYSRLWLGEAVERLDASDAVRRWPECNVFVSWPSYSMPWAREMAEKIAPGRTLAVIGEDRSGCTADAGFFDLLGSGYDEVGSVRIPQWPGIHDVLTIHVRKP